jgi:crotonobetainyl-CoA:carnitine CoA-transferase CaiB-like acyl-CoA transferase
LYLDVTRDLVDRAFKCAELDVPEDLAFSVVGEEPVLPSPHYLATGAAAARILTGVGANELWYTRTGRRQELHVDLRHAAAALRSYLHLALLEREPRESRDIAAHMRLGGIVPTRDGRHVHLHPSFNDAAKILAELGLPDDADRAQVEAAVASRDAFELQDGFIRRRICGGVVMSREEWERHPQGRALRDLPLVSITKIGEAPAEPLPDGDRPAAGIRVADLTRVLAGPTCAKTLAEHGADVLHISAPGLERGGQFEIETGIGKRQCYIDLRSDDGIDTLRALLSDADVFSQGYRLGSIARRGFSPEAVAGLRPGIVYVSENCYGHVGPWAERPGWEQLGQAASGMSYREGFPDTPKLAPAAVNDYTTGYLAAYGAMIALARRATIGGSWLVQVSLARTCMWYQDLGDDNDRDDADPGDVSPFIAEMDTADFGRIRYLTPALSMSETMPRWDLPPSAHGAHEPVWIER